MQKFGRLGVLFFLILLFVFQLLATGQNKKNFVITGKVDPEVTTAKSGLVEISQTGGAKTNVEVPKSGRFRLELEYFKEYTLTFTYPGNFSKTIVISTDIPQDVWERDNDFPPYPMVVKLMKETEGIDKSFTLKPSGKVFYSKQTDNFESEIIVKDAQIAEQVNNAKKLSGEVKKEEKTINKEEAQDLAVKQRNYDQSIGEADALFKKGEYLNAMLKYQDAKKLFPEKPYANDRIAEIQDLVKVLENTEKQKAELENKYKEAIAKANGLFEQKTYQKARPAYEEAMQIKPGDAFSQQRIQEIDRLIALQGKQKQFDDLIAQADNNYQSKKLDQALTLYTQAKQLIPENPYPQKQIELINQAKEQQAKAEQQEKDYQAIIARADQSFNSKEYTVAQADYTKAVSLKPNDTYPANRLKEIDQILKKEQDARLVEENYKSVIAKADKSFAAQSYTEARKVYGEALVIKPNEAYPTSQISKIDGIMAEKANQQEKDYQAIIAKADQSFNSKEYTIAQADYTKAVSLKPNDTYPANRLKEIDQLLKQEQEARRIEENYKSVIAKADKSFAAQSYTEARKVYGEALVIKPNEAYPTSQISKIDGIIADKARQQQTEADFLAIVGKGDAAFTQKEYQPAKSLYTEALAIKPNSAEVKAKLKNIENILQKIADDKRKEEERIMAESKEKEKAYNAAINAANKNITDKRYPEAKAKYQEALQFMPDAAYPKQQIERLDALLAQAGAERQKEELYASTIKEADALFAGKNYSGAKISYTKAAEIKPSEAHPTNRIKEIDKILNDLALEDAKNKALEANYQETIQKADQQFNAKEYPSARTTYEQAQAIKPNEQYPKTRIAEIDKLMADQLLQQYQEAIAAGDRAFKSDELAEATTQYENALKIKVNDPYSKKQLVEITKRKAALQAEQDRLKRLDEQYAALMADAETKFNGKNYELAKVKYQEALTLKPQEALPKEQIERINALLAEMRNAAETNRLYAQSIKTAEEAFRQNKLKEARDAYQKAQNYKPAEPVPPAKIAELDAMIAQLEESARLAAQEEANRLAKEKADMERYNQAIAEGDKAFAEKKYPEARTHYSDALNVFSTQKYPKDQISRIDALIARQEEDNRKAAVLAQSNKPVQANQVPASPLSASAKTAQATTASSNYRSINNYDEAISKADDAFGIKDYTAARLLYYKASAIKPNEEYPKNQILLINKLVNSELSSIDRSGYDNIITQADEAFNDKKYSIAKFFYYKALEVKPWEKYPKDRIHEILVLTNSLLSEKEEKEYNDYISRADEALAGKDASIARFYYNKAIAIKKNEEYPISKLKDIQQMMDQEKLDQKNSEYNKIIEVADQAMQSGSYSVARFNYNKALAMKPNEKYPQDQLIKIREALKKQNK